MVTPTIRDGIFKRIVDHASTCVGLLVAGDADELLVDRVAAFVNREADTPEGRVAVVMWHITILGKLAEGLAPEGAPMRLTAPLHERLDVADLVAVFDRTILEAALAGVSLEEQAAEMLSADDAN